MSIFSSEADGLGFHYAWYADDTRQLNVRQEMWEWIAYVGGERIGAFTTREAAEDAAVEWVRSHPQDDAD